MGKKADRRGRSKKLLRATDRSSFAPTHLKTQNSLAQKRIKKAIQKAIQTQKGISCKDILSLTKSFPNFIGCFAQDAVTQLQFRSKPVLFLVNTDSTGSKGSHWIAIGLFKNSIEVFDPLGFEIFNWAHIPCSLLKFIHNHSANRQLLIADRVQSNSSSLCGFYCLFYVLKRPFISLSEISALFSKRLSENDKLLFSLFYVRVILLYFQMAFDNGELDYKITKKHYPRNNTSDLLEFVFDKDPNLFLRKNKIIIRGWIKLPDIYVVENGWVAKLFRNLSVKLDSQEVLQCQNE